MIEGLLFAAGEEGLRLLELARLLEVPRTRTKILLQEMQQEWNQEQRGIQIVQVADIYQLTTLPEHVSYLRKMARIPTRTSLSKAAMETLAIVAYQQPVTRADVEEIRGVRSDRVLSQLQRKQLIREVGRAEGPGRPILFGTTKEFLNYMGLNRLEELPASESLFNWQEREKDRDQLYEKFEIERAVTEKQR